MRNFLHDHPIGDPFDRNGGRTRYCDPVSAIVSVGSQLLGADSSRHAANQAADAQREAAQQAQAQQQQAFNTAQENLAPYRALGQQGITGVQGLLGLNGAEAQQAAINALQNSPQFSALVNQGENAMRQNAAATGGLRGGNFQAALQHFRPQVLSQLIDQQYSRLGGLLNTGQNAAAGVGQAALQTGNQISNLQNDMGAYGAGAALAGGRAQAGLLNNLGQGASYIGQQPGGFSGFLSKFQNPFGGGGDAGFSWAQPQSSATQNALFGSVGYG
jgi:hypothetical protein